MGRQATHSIGEQHRERYLPVAIRLAGRLVSEIRQFSDSEAANELAVYRYSYSDNSTTLPNTVTDPLGNLHTFHLNANGQILVASPRRRASGSRCCRRASLAAPACTTGLGSSGRAALFDFDSAETLTTLCLPQPPAAPGELLLSWRAASPPRPQRARPDQGPSSATIRDTKLLYRAAVTDQLAETSVRQQFNYRGGCLASESVELPSPDSHLSIIGTSLDAELRLVSIETVVGGSGGSIAARTVVVNTTLDPDGRAMRRFHFDSMGRLVENTLHFASGPGSGFDARAFVLSLHSCSLGRPERLVYGLANEAQLTQAQRGQVTSRQRIIYRAATVESPPRSIESPPPAAAEWLNYTYDSRGACRRRRARLRRRRLPQLAPEPEAARAHGEHFRFNAKGQLLRADCVADGGTQVYSLHYLYDSRDRLVARLDLLDRSRDFQLMYADPASPWRVSHAFFPHGNRLATFVYENRTERAYIVCDHLGSPLALLDSRGIALNQLSYSHTGLLTVSKQTAQLPFATPRRHPRPDAQLVLLPPGQRVYDPLTGQWAAPDYSGLARRLHAGFGDSPLGLTNLDGLTFDHLAGEADAAYDSLAVSRPNFWLANFNVRPEASTATIVSAMDSTAGSSLTSPLAGLRDSPTSRLSMIEKIDSGSGGGLALNSTGRRSIRGAAAQRLRRKRKSRRRLVGIAASDSSLGAGVPRRSGAAGGEAARHGGGQRLRAGAVPGLEGDKQVVHLAWPERAGLMNTHLQAVFGSSVDLTRSRFELPR
uniref:RHS repeat-associated core domain-containing protein n=1 Tax=Macrostomum lignano TaxID=282301 RepID=A0A1I8F369_9PLAT